MGWQVVKYVSSASPTLFLTGGDDKTLRLWDSRTASEARADLAPISNRSRADLASTLPVQVRQLTFDGGVSSVEISRDQRTATVAAGNQVARPAAAPANPQRTRRIQRTRHTPHHARRRLGARLLSRARARRAPRSTRACRGPGVVLGPE